MDYLQGGIEQLNLLASLLSVAIRFLIASIAGCMWQYSPMGIAED